MEHTINGRTWVAVGREPYTRKDGTQTELIRWQIKCAKCETMVEITTPAKFDTTKAFGSKHCPAHRLTQDDVMELRRNAQKAARLQKKAD